MLPFPTVECPNWSWENVHRHWVPGDPYQPEKRTRDYYRLKHAAVMFTGARKIGEIGVRAGYSAAAMVSVPWNVQYVGFDNDAGHHGGVVGYFPRAEAVLSHYPNAQGSFHLADSQTLTELPGGPYDLVHVDGDHTYLGARHDIELCLDSGTKWVLVDDYDFLQDVRRAVDDVVRDRGLTEVYYIGDKGYRGTVLMRNNKV